MKLYRDYFRKHIKTKNISFIKNLEKKEQISFENQYCRYLIFESKLMATITDMKFCISCSLIYVYQYLSNVYVYSELNISFSYSERNIIIVNFLSEIYSQLIYSIS